jgi:hypothetical protein
MAKKISENSDFHRQDFDVGSYRKRGIILKWN